MKLQVPPGRFLSWEGVSTGSRPPCWWHSPSAESAPQKSPEQGAKEHPGPGGCSGGLLAPPHPRVWKSTQTPGGMKASFFPRATTGNQGGGNRRNMGRLDPSLSCAGGRCTEGCSPDPLAGQSLRSDGCPGHRQPPHLSDTEIPDHTILIGFATFP